MAFSDFAARGGAMRIVCSHSLDRSDVSAISAGMTWRDLADKAFADTIRETLESPTEQPVARLLATLVARGHLDLRVAIRPSQPGIFHDKIGLFKDGDGNVVSFAGSINETFSAWDPRINHEGFEVFSSWAGGSDAARVLRHQRYFEDLWSGTHPGITTYELPAAVRAELLEFQDIEGLDSASLRVRRHLGAALEKTSTSRGDAERPRELQPHQKEVIANWERNGFRGIVTHVTGAGKTISALAGVRNWIQSGRTALIIVPSEILLNQWQKEVERDLGGNVDVLLAGAGHGRSEWQGQLADFTRGIRDFGPRVVLSTVQSASQKAFLGKVQQGRHLLIVADEVHRLGAASYRQLLSLDTGGALGLSATPQRYGDWEGTKAIYDYFGPELEPKIGIAEAIKLKRLVPYDYFVHRVSLDEREAKEWSALSEDIKKAYASLPKNERGDRVSTARYQLLLIQRARIIKSAESKAALALQVLREHFKPGDRWLVYCDDQRQLKKVLSLLRKDRIDAFEYHSAMEGSRNDTMSAFTVHGGVLVAIKCLDEGVDIPLVNKALILASSSNPREFIQRRGRVLRATDQKFSAAIHDALVLPESEVIREGGGPPSYARTDLARAAKFSAFARNTAVGLQIRMWCDELGITDAEGEMNSFEEDEEHG